MYALECSKDLTLESDFAWNFSPQLKRMKFFSKNEIATNSRHGARLNILISFSRQKLRENQGSLQKQTDKHKFTLVFIVQLTYRTQYTPAFIVIITSEKAMTCVFFSLFSLYFFFFSFFHRHASVMLMVLL